MLCTREQAQNRTNGLEIKKKKKTPKHLLQFSLRNIRSTARSSHSRSANQNVLENNQRTKTHTLHSWSLHTVSTTGKTTKMLSAIGLQTARIARTNFAATAALHTSAVRKFDIPFLKQIPQPPGNIVGTVNDAYVPPKPSKSHGSLHWTAERAIAIGMVPLVTVPFITGSIAPVLDATFASLLLAHAWIGFQSCIIDYIPERVYGRQHAYAMWLLTFGTGIAAYGIYEIESKDVGLTGIMKKLWTKPEEKK